MYSILTLNKIAACGTDRFSADYTCGSEIKNPTAIMVRSASMHDMELSADTIAIARAGAGTNYKINRTVKSGEVYTIVEEVNGWGRLKSGAGWISLAYTKKY